MENSISIKKDLPMVRVFDRLSKDYFIENIWLHDHYWSQTKGDDQKGAIV